MKKFWNWIRDDSGGRVLRLEGPIDEDDLWGDAVTPKAFRDELEADTGDITVWVNSPGGSVFAAAEIYTMLRDYPGAVTVKVASVAASAASVVVVAGDVVQMSPTALLFLHDPSTIAIGNARDMEKVIQTLEKVKESIITAYMAKTGLSHNRISKLMENESWIPAKEAVELGFADEVLFDEKETTPEAPEADAEEASGVSVENVKDTAKTMDTGLYSMRRMGMTILNRLGVYPVLSRQDAPEAQEASTPKAEPESPQDAAQRPQDAPEAQEAPTPKAEPEAAQIAPGRAQEANPVPAIGLDGKTADGAMPYVLLRKQLDFLR